MILTYDNFMHREDRSWLANKNPEIESASRIRLKVLQFDIVTSAVEVVTAVWNSVGGVLRCELHWGIPIEWSFWVLKSRVGLNDGTTFVELVREEECGAFADASAGSWVAYHSLNTVAVSGLEI
jgi:hypothetical protein